MTSWSPPSVRPLLCLAAVTQLVTHYRCLQCSPEQRQLALDSGVSNLLPVMTAGNHSFMAIEGTVYLLHFERPYNGPMQHYVGFAVDGHLNRRLEAHRDGTGGRTTRLAFEKGITFVLARTWPGTSKLERQIKSRGPSNYCPLCPRRRSNDSAPSDPIGANGLPGKITSRVSALCARVGDATSGSALYCDLARRKNRRHRWTGHPH